jgi:hypothetical protein
VEPVVFNTFWNLTLGIRTGDDQEKLDEMLFIYLLLKITPTLVIVYNIYIHSDDTLHW